MQTNSEAQSTDISNKPILIFTNFWDANVAVRDGYIIVSDEEEFYKVSLRKNSAGKPENFEVNSIALQHPPLDKIPDIKNSTGFIHTIDILCPTFNILMERKNGGSWEKYTESFMELVKDRKSDIKNWIKSLEPKIYLLCCWENTSGEAKCHRQLLYDAFKKSKFILDNALIFYRHGGRKDIDINDVSSQTVNMGEQGVEYENKKITRLKRLGVIDEHPRYWSEDTISIGGVSNSGRGGYAQGISMTAVAAAELPNPGEPPSPGLTNGGASSNMHLVDLRDLLSSATENTDDLL